MPDNTKKTDQKQQPDDTDFIAKWVERCMSIAECQDISDEGITLFFAFVPAIERWLDDHKPDYVNGKGPFVLGIGITELEARIRLRKKLTEFFAIVEQGLAAAIEAELGKMEGN